MAPILINIVPVSDVNVRKHDVILKLSVEAKTKRTSEVKQAWKRCSDAKYGAPNEMACETDKIKLRKEKKQQKLRKQKADWYRRNTARSNNEHTHDDVTEKRENSQSAEAVRKRDYRKRKRERNEKRAAYQRKWRSTTKSLPSADVQVGKFPNRMSKMRAINKMKTSLPLTPTKRAATLAAYLQNERSPVVKSLKKIKLISPQQDEKERILFRAMVSDLRDSLSSKKKKRSNEARTEMNSLTSSFSGEFINQSKCKMKLANKLGLPARTISKGYRIRSQIQHTDESCFKYTIRSTRKDAISEDDKKTMYDFWCAPENSHPTRNKNDIKRMRIGVKSYTSHTVQVLRKTQAEIYEDFTQAHPNIKISLKSFERCKPYFIRQPSAKDRMTCCCRYHLEMKSVFKRCMDFRNRFSDSLEVPVWDNMYDLCTATLCNPDDCGRFNKECLDRKCQNCGVDEGLFSSMELSTDENALTVKWECFEYKDIHMKGVCKRKLLLVKRETKPGEMFQCLIKLLKTFPAHNFRSKWQSAQFTSIVNNLPQKHCITVNDYSENYQCSEKIEIQSSYFQKTEISIHVSLLYRHAIQSIDGIQSTQEEPEVVLEHFYTIFPDEKHDQHSTHRVQEEISSYLKSINYEVDIMHEYCDGCAVQYKSRNCYGDLAASVESYGYNTLIRNFYETSHAKGPQDAAGGLLKRQADLAILRGSVVIQNARDLYDFAECNLTQTKSEKCHRRIFKYCATIDRSTPRTYKSMPGIRSTHQVIARKNQPLQTRYLSCYECSGCVYRDVSSCTNKRIVGEITTTCPVADITGVSDNQTVDEEPLTALHDLVHDGTVFAAVCNDEEYEYYLVRADTESFILETTTTDEWGTTWNAGTSVIQGRYFV